MLKIPILILDLDNTIYPVSSIGEELFRPLFEIMEKPEYGLGGETLEEARKDVQRIPFQKVAGKYKFPEELTQEALSLLRSLSYENDMSSFADYHLVKEYPCTRILVTSGFTKLQQSKITKLGLEPDFEEMFIIDPDLTDKVKKDIFEEIIKKHDLKKDDVIVIGDDPDSEIQAALDLGLHSILLDPNIEFDQNKAEHTVRSLKEATAIIKQKAQP
jgi:putative hydrolase of the HAD superfamily